MNSLELRNNCRMLEINGKTYRLDFDMEALSQTEQVYHTHYGRDVNIRDIIAELIQVKISAIMALTYGAMVSADNRISWKEFSKDIFTYDTLDSVLDVVLGAVTEMMADPKDDAGAGAEKN